MGSTAQSVGSPVPKASKQTTVTPIEKHAENSIENNVSRQGFASRFSRRRTRFAVLIF